MEKNQPHQEFGDTYMCLNVIPLKVYVFFVLKYVTQLRIKYACGTQS